MKTSNRLTTLQLPALLKQPGRHRDGDGLILLVRENGAAFWVLRYMLGGKARELGLGPLRLVNLAEARARAREARQALLDKRDPVEIKHADAAGAAPRAAPHDHLRRGVPRGSWQPTALRGFRNAVHRKQWRSTLAKAYPVLGDPAAAVHQLGDPVAGVAADHEGHAGDRKPVARQASRG